MCVLFLVCIVLMTLARVCVCYIDDLGVFCREIMEVFMGQLPHLHTQPECRCPPTHPRVHPLVERYCIPNGEEDTTTNRVLRLNLDAHPLSYINDNDIGTAWVSHVFTTTEDMDQGVTLTFDLENGQYQVRVLHSTW